MVQNKSNKNKSNKNKGSNNSGNITGRNIYLDNHGQTVFYDVLTKKGYIIDNKVESKFYLLKNRFFLIAIAIILLGEYFSNWIQAVIAGAAICILAELYFRFMFLKSLRETTKFDRGKRQTMLKATIESNEPRKVLLRAVLYCAFAILIVANALMMKADIAIIVISILLCVAASYCAVINVIALIKMK